MAGLELRLIGNPADIKEIPPFVDALGPWPQRAICSVALAPLGFVVVLLPWLVAARTRAHLRGRIRAARRIDRRLRLEADATAPRAGAQPRHNAARHRKFHGLDLLRIESDGRAVTQRQRQGRPMFGKNPDLVAAQHLR